MKKVSAGGIRSQAVMMSTPIMISSSSTLIRSKDISAVTEYFFVDTCHVTALRKNYVKYSPVLPSLATIPVQFNELHVRLTFVGQ